MNIDGCISAEKKSQNIPLNVNNLSVCLSLPVSLRARYASAVTDGSQYFILLIISDGVITDMAQTKESIVNVQYQI